MSIYLSFKPANLISILTLNLLNPLSQFCLVIFQILSFLLSCSFSTVLYSALQCSTVLYSALQYSTVLYTLQCSTVLYSALRCSTVLYSALQCSTVLYSARQYSTVLYSALQFSTVLYSALQCSTVLDNALQCFTRYKYKINGSIFFLKSTITKKFFIYVKLKKISSWI